jgi:phosphoglycerate dehydrogenase-like enzyme
MAKFAVGVTRDFGPGGETAGLIDKYLADCLGTIPGLGYEFLGEYKHVVSPDQVDDYDVVISDSPMWTAASFEGVTRLAGVAFWGAGYHDYIDVGAATAADVAVCNTRTAVKRPVAESALCFLLALSKNLLIKDRLTREGRFGPDERREHTGQLVYDRVVGCVGFGNTGSEFVRLVSQFGPSHILVSDPYADRDRAAQAGVELVDLPSLLQEADYVVVMAPLTDETVGMIGSAQLQLMKPSAYLINVARGKIIDQQALTRALQDGWIRGAALDVFEKEPPPSDDPILRLDNVIVTAHCITWTEEMYHDNTVENSRSVLEIFRGVPPASVVNGDVLGRPGFQKKLAAYAARKGS